MHTFRSERVFSVVNTIFFIAVCLIMVLPMIHIAAMSASGDEFINSRLVTFWPRGLTLTAYKTVVGEPAIWRSMGVSIYITVFGTLMTLILTSSLAYALSRTYMPARKLIMKGIIVTFIFSIPLIPYFLLVRSLGMYNTLWALMVPGALGAFNVIIMKTFFQGISQELFDAATIDGCNEFGVYFRIVIPLSTAVIATIGLFQAVGLWNNYFSGLIFIRSGFLRPVQLVLRGMIVDVDFLSSGADQAMGEESYIPERLKAAAILFTMVPILIVYPFLQKYFVKGAMLGSLKG